MEYAVHAVGISENLVHAEKKTESSNRSDPVYTTHFCAQSQFLN